MTRALDAHLIALGLRVEVRGDRHAVDADRGLERLGGGLRQIAPREIDLDPVQDRLQDLAVDEPRDPLDHRFGEEVRLRQLRQGIARDRLAFRRGIKGGLD